MHCTECIHSLFNGGFYLFSVRDICNCCNNLCIILLAQPLRRFFNPFGAVYHTNLCTVLHKCFCNTGAQSYRRTGNNGYFTVQFSHLTPLLKLFGFIIPFYLFGCSHFEWFVQYRCFGYSLIGQQFFVHDFYNRCHPFICGAVASRCASVKVQCFIQCIGRVYQHFNFFAGNPLRLSVRYRYSTSGKHFLFLRGIHSYRRR